MFTIESLYQMFPDFRHLTPETTITKPISMVTVLDDPAIHEWMRGEELLITSGYIFSQHPEVVFPMLEKLVKKNVSALAIKVSRFMGELPANFLQRAIDLDFTIIEIPPKYSFSDIINPVHAELVNQRFSEMQINEEMSQRFLQIGVADVSYEKILELLGRYVHCRVYYYSLSDNIIYSPKRSVAVPPFEELNSATFSCFGVSYQKRHYGNLYVEGPCGSFTETSAIRHAIIMFRLSIQTLLSNLRHEEQRRNDFLSDVIFNNFNSKAEIDLKAREFGWTLDQHVFCGVIQIIESRPTNLNHDLREEKYEQLREIVKKRLQDGYYIYLSNYIVVLFVGKDAAVKQAELKILLDDINHLYIHDNVEFIGGLGQTYSDITLASKSFIEARKAATIGRRLFERNYNQFEEIALYDCMMDMMPQAQSLPMVQTLLELERTDERKHTCHISTLEWLIRSDWNMQKASRELNVHYNTMKYRVGQLRNATNWEFEEREEKFQIETALKILRLSKDLEEHNII